MKQLVIKAPAHRYYSVYGLLLQCKARILNQDDLDLAALAREPLWFKFATDSMQQIELGLEELRKEFGEEFTLKGAGQ